MTKNVFLLRKIITFSNGIKTRFEIFSEMFQKSLMSKQWYGCAKNHSLLFLPSKSAQVTKNEHFLKNVSWGSIWVTKNEDFLKQRNLIFWQRDLSVFLLCFILPSLVPETRSETLTKPLNIPTLTVIRSDDPLLVMMMVMFIRAP